MNRKILITLLLTIVFFASACNVIQKNPEEFDIIKDTDMILANNKETDYKVVIPAQASDSEKMAASEFTYFFTEATGTAIEVITDENLQYDAAAKYISLGETTLLKAKEFLPAYANTGSDGYIIKTVDSTIFISGAKGNGTIFGVYRFLEATFDYRYYAKDEIYLSKKDKVFVKAFDLLEKPTFASRNLDTLSLYEDGQHLTRMRLTPSLHRKFDHFTDGWSSLHDQSMTLQILPYEQYSHKDGWYSGDRYTGQLNFTKAYYDEEMFEEFTNNLINNFVAVETNAKYFMLGMNDNPYNYKNQPHIEDYDTYMGSGVMVRFVNKVSERVQEWIDINQPGREIFLVMFAYYFTVEPPVRFDAELNQYVPLDDSVVCNDNVMVRIAPIHSHYIYPHLNADVNADAAAAFGGWGAVTKNLAVWDYGTNFTGYIAPFPDWGTLKPNLQMYRDKGVRDILVQLSPHTLGCSLNDFKIFMRSQLMWNVDADFHKLQKDFFDNYYKAAAPAMQKYYDYIVMHYQTSIDKYKGNIYYDAVYTSAFWEYGQILQLEKFLQEALAAIEPLETTSPEDYAKVKDRLTTESLFYRLVLINAFSAYYAADNVSQMIDAFEADARKYGLVSISNQTFFDAAGRTDKGLISNVIRGWRSNLVG